MEREGVGIVSGNYVGSREGELGKKVVIWGWGEKEWGE